MRCTCGYGSIPINTIFSGMNIHLPAILGFTRYQGFDPSPCAMSRDSSNGAKKFVDRLSDSDLVKAFLWSMNQGDLEAAGTRGRRIC